MITLFSSNYLSRTPIEKATQAFGSSFSRENRILDIGCGDKPYAHFFTCQYIGLDPFPGAKADVVHPAWDTGLEDSSFDGIILNQSLEHIAKTEETIAEIFRLLKPGGRVLVTVPQTVRNHTTPIASEKVPFKNFNTEDIPYWNEDYYRFTKFGLIYLFRNFSILKLKESNSYLTTLVQLWNYFLASFGVGIIFSPFYLVNNLLGIFFDFLFFSIGKLPFSSAKKFDHLITRGLTLNYILIAKKI